MNQEQDENQAQSQSPRAMSPTMELEHGQTLPGTDHSQSASQRLNMYIRQFDRQTVSFAVEYIQTKGSSGGFGSSLLCFWKMGSRRTCTASRNCWQPQHTMSFAALFRR